MVKRSLIFMLILSALSCSSALFAIRSGDWEYIFYDQHNITMITKYYGNGTNVKIPDILDGHTVDSIGIYTFRDRHDLTSVTIPDSIKGIGDGAFADCSGLTSIILPDSLISIGNRAFEGSGLTSIIIPDGVKSISSRAFTNCFSLTSIVIPDSVTSIEEYAFRSCWNLTSVTIPDSVK